jgi:hypothetical protein
LTERLADMVAALPALTRRADVSATAGDRPPLRHTSARNQAVGPGPHVFPGSVGPHHRRTGSGIRAGRLPSAPVRLEGDSQQQQPSSGGAILAAFGSELPIESRRQRGGDAGPPLPQLLPSPFLTPVSALDPAANAVPGSPSPREAVRQAGMGRDHSQEAPAPMSADRDPSPVQLPSETAILARSTLANHAASPTAAAAAAIPSSTIPTTFSGGTFTLTAARRVSVTGSPVPPNAAAPMSAANAAAAMTARSLTMPRTTAPPAVVVPPTSIAAPAAGTASLAAATPPALLSPPPLLPHPRSSTTSRCSPLGSRARMRMVLTLPYMCCLVLFLTACCRSMLACINGKSPLPPPVVPAAAPGLVSHRTTATIPAAPAVMDPASWMCRALVIMDRPLQQQQGTGGGGGGAIGLTFVIPPNSPLLGGTNRHAVRGLQLGPALSVCPPNRYVLRMATHSIRGTNSISLHPQDD